MTPREDDKLPVSRVLVIFIRYLLLVFAIEATIIALAFWLGGVSL